MPSKNPAQRLRDILENLEIISEASRRLPEELKARHPGIDWAAVGAAGNVYRHEYEAVDEAQAWQTIQRDLAELKKAATEELDRLAT